MKKEKSRLPTALLLVGFAILAFAGGYFWVAGTGGRNSSPPPSIDGIPCEAMEGTALHIHIQLQLYRNGQSLLIPAGVGGVGNCFYWLHTHTPDGVVHVESPVLREFRLGEFADIWGKWPFPPKADLKVLIDRQDGKGFQVYSGDFRNLVLRAHMVVAIGEGTFTPKSFTFGPGL